MTEQEEFEFRLRLERERATSLPPKTEKKPEPQWSDLPGNIPGSAAKLAGGFIDAVTSPVQTASNVMDMAAGGLRNVMPEFLRKGIDAFDWNPAAAQRATAAADAVGSFYKDRYGGLGEVKNTLITDPVGAAADLSTVLGVGGMVAPGKVGAALNTASRFTNPVNAIKPAAKAVGAVGKNVLGLSTGVGAENIAEAARSGYAGKNAFLKNATGETAVTDVLDKAKQNLQAMRTNRSGLYKQNIQTTAADTTRLNFKPIDKALSDVVDSMKFGGKWKIGKEQVSKIDEVAGIVDEWRADPSLHTPMGLDALKQRLDAVYPDSPMHNQAQRAITAVRNAVKDAIVTQSPKYAKTMADYEKAIVVEKEIERALSLGTKASQDTAMRKLQSLSRNNVNTNYGNRLKLAKTLEDQGGVDLMPDISGQAMNSWAPRGLTGQAGSLATMGGALFSNPYMALALPFQSPKAVGLTMYGLGRGASFADRAMPDNAGLMSLLAAQAGQQFTDW